MNCLMERCSSNGSWSNVLLSFFCNRRSPEYIVGAIEVIIPRQSRGL